MLPFVLLVLTCAFKPFPVFSQEMKSDGYVLQGGNLNSASGARQSSGFRLNDLLGETQALVFNAKGAWVQSGIQNSYANSVLGLSLSPPIVNYGKLTPGSPVNKNLIITVSSAQLPGFTVYASQNSPLEGSDGKKIPDTLCGKSKNKFCTPGLGKRWTDNGVFGFGYSLSGQKVASDFTGGKIFRPFAASSDKEKPVAIISSWDQKNSHTANMTLKINVSDGLSEGVYRNILKFTLLPGF